MYTLCLCVYKIITTEHYLSVLHVIFCYLTVILDLHLRRCGFTVYKLYYTFICPIVKMVSSVASFKYKRDSLYFCSSIKVYIVWFSYTTIFGYLRYFMLSVILFMYIHIWIFIQVLIFEIVTVVNISKNKLSSL